MATSSKKQSEFDILKKHRQKENDSYSGNSNTQKVDKEGYKNRLLSIINKSKESDYASKKAAQEAARETAMKEWQSQLGIGDEAFKSWTTAYSRLEGIKKTGGTNDDWYQEMLAERDNAVLAAEEAKKVLERKRDGYWENGMYFDSEAHDDKLMSLLERQLEDAQKRATYANNNLQYAESLRYDDIEARKNYDVMRDEGQKIFNMASSAAEKKAKAEYDRQYEDFMRQGTGGLEFSQDTMTQLRNDTSWREPQDVWAQEEKDTFYYLFSQNRDEAYKYAENLNNFYNAQKAYEQQEKTGEWATQNVGTGALATAGALAAAPFSIGDFLDNAVEYAARGTVTQKDTLTLADRGNAMTSAIVETLNSKPNAANEALSKLSPVFGEVGVGDLYSVAFNALQSLTYGAVGGAVGAGIAYFGIGAKSGFEDAVSRGATPGQALVAGLLDGTIEQLTETYSIDKLLNIRTPSTFAQLLKNTLVQGGIEASEETMSALLGSVGDAFVMGDKSALNASAQEYMLQGMSYEEAQKQATKDWLKEVAYSAASGFLSGGFGATVQSGRQAFGKYQGDTESLIQKGLNTPEGSRARLNAETLANKVDAQNNKKGTQDERQSEAPLFISKEQRNSGESMSFAAPKGGRITNLQAQRLAELTAQEEARSRLEAQGVDVDDKTLDAIGHALSTNDELSRKEKAILQDEKVGDVATQMRVSEILGREWDYDNQKDKDPVIKSNYDVSEDGKTIDTTTGEEVTIEKIDSLSKGKMTLKLSNGKVVSSDSVSYGSNGEALIYETVASLDTLPVIANELVRGYDPASGVSPEVYARGIQEAFVYGQYNLPESEMLAEGTFSADLTAEQRQLAYKSGQKFSGMAIAKQQAEIKKGKAVTKVGAVANQTHINDFNPSAFDISTEQGQRQRTSYNVAKMMSEVLGVDIYVFESYVKGNKRVYIDEKGNEVEAPNGYYKNGAIHIDLNAGNNGEGTMLFTLSHELAHFIREWSPAKFKVLANFLNEQYGKKGISIDVLVRQQMKKARDAGRVLTYDEAYEEFVADSMETMLTDGKVAEKLALLKQQDKSLWQKIRDFISDIYAKVTKAYEGMNPNSAEGKYVSEMVDALENLQQLFAEGLAEASVNYQGSFTPDKAGTVFPTKDSAFGSMKDLIESGLEEDAIIEGKRERGLSAIVDEIEKSLPRTEVEIEEVEVKQADRDLEAGVKYQARDSRGNVVVDEEVTPQSVKKTLIDIFDGKYKKQSFTFPVLKHTPQVFMDYCHMDGDRSFVMQAYKAYKAMKGDNKNQHNLGVDGMMDVIYGLYYPEYIVLQNGGDNDGHYAAVVTINNGETVVAVDLGSYRPKEAAVNGEAGYYNVIITAFPNEDDYIDRVILAENNDVLYSKDEGKKYEIPEYVAGADSATGRTSDTSEKSIAKRDSKVNYSLRNQSRGNANLEKVNAVLEKQNAKLREDVKELKELLKIQKSVTNGTKLTPSSVEAVSKKLMRDIHSKGEVSELKALLGAFYSEVRNNESTSLDDYKELAQPVVDWLHNHMVTEETKQDASAFAYESDLIEQDIFSQVLSSYWDVSTLHTVADVKQKQINELKAKHNARIAELRKAHKQDVSALKTAHKEEVARIRTEARKERLAAEREIIRKYQESRKNSVESRAKTAEKAKIRKKISAINKLLNRGTKERNVKEGLQEVAAQALKTADILFTEAYSDNDMIRDGIQTPMTADEKRYMAEAKSLLDRISKLPIGTDERNNLEGQLNYRKGKLKDVLFRERARLYDSDVSMALDELAKVYKKIKESPYSYIAEAYDEEVAKMLETMSEEIGGKKIRDMTLANLELVNDAYTMVLTTIRNANKAFVNGKDITEMGDAVVNEVRAVGGHKKMRGVISNAINQFGWNNMKPVYAFKAIGSDTLSKLFDNVRAGEDTWARDVYDARSFFRAQAAKTGYDKWDMAKSYTFTSTSGLEFSLTLEQMMSLYAFSKREQALDHLRKGGIVFDENTEIEAKGKLGIKQKFNPSDATAYNISAETLAEITGKLSKQQIAFVDAMQDYLSTTMGEKGNEVSMALYGVKLFKEKFYFPLRSATQYQERAKEAGKRERKVKNSGFTKPTTPKAGNPIVLAPFMDVWSNHVNDMSMYHAFVLPMEDFYKVYNYKTAAEEDTAIESVNAAIQNAYGRGAINYIDTLLKDLNGGARTDPTAGVISKAMGLFKKGAVFASASVVVQQPSAIARAFAEIDSKYFVGKNLDSKKHKALWEEVKKYAPVAMIKEMGYFDTNMGKSTADFIKAKEHKGAWDVLTNLDGAAAKENAVDFVKDSGYRDEVFSKLPALADELAWCKIWNAVKLETADKHKNLKVGSEEFLQVAGKRFTEVIVNTQVYDSVLARSANMRSKDTGMKMATAFLAEPTTAINMVADALIQGKRGNAKKARRIIGSVIGAQILNDALSSFVYAARDDDEDETYWEKYLASFFAEVKDSLNPATYIPFLKDIVSLVQGYDVERSDMAVIADIVNAYRQLDSDKISGWRKVENFAGGIAQLFGLPVKNIMRDTRALWQTINNAFTGESYTAAGAKYAIKEALTREATSNGEQLLNALIEGDKAHEERVRARFKDESAATSAIRSAIKAGFESGEFDEQTATDLLMQHTGLDENETYWKIKEWLSEDSDFSKYGKVYEGMKAGENIDAAIEELTAHGHTERGVRSQIKSTIGAWYTDGEITRSQAESMLSMYADMGDEQIKKSLDKWTSVLETGIPYDEIKQEYLDGKITESEAIEMRMQYGGYDREDAEDTLKDWNFEKKFGFAYSDRAELLADGKISRDTLITAVMEYKELDRAAATAAVNYLEFQIEYPQYKKLSQTKYESYFVGLDDVNGKSPSSAGIDLGVYAEYYISIADIKGDDADGDGKTDRDSKKNKILAVINSLPLSNAQKDILYLQQYARSGIRNAPWH